MGCIDLQAQITKLQAQIAAIDLAIIAIIDNKVESYTLDTGQSRQTVTRQNISELIKDQAALINLCTSFELRLNGSGVSYGGGAW